MVQGNGRSNIWTWQDRSLRKLCSHKVCLQWPSMVSQATFLSQSSVLQVCRALIICPLDSLKLLFSNPQLLMSLQNRRPHIWTNIGSYSLSQYTLLKTKCRKDFFLKVKLGRPSPMAEWLKFSSLCFGSLSSQVWIDPYWTSNELNAYAKQFVPKSKSFSSYQYLSSTSFYFP